jgi:hypothetical protein
MWTLMSATAVALHETNGHLVHMWISVPQIDPAYSSYDEYRRTSLTIEDPVFHEMPHSWVFAAVIVVLRVELLRESLTSGASYFITTALQTASSRREGLSIHKRLITMVGSKVSVHSINLGLILGKQPNCNVLTSGSQ